MNILFFCGSLEPGRDGVGDYTRRLAGACAARGHGCTVIALHDSAAGRSNELTPENVRLIRLSRIEDWPARLACALEHLRRLSPDWVSWQIVASSFHPRGFLPGSLLQQAPELRGPRGHLMLHELWLGLETGAGWRARVIGWLQRRGVLCLLNQLDADSIQTSNATYQRALGRAGFEASVLELFGNVPVADALPAGAQPLNRWLPPATGRPGPAPLVAVTFGTLHRQWEPAATVAWLRTTARRLDRAPFLLALGRAGSHAAEILSAFRHDRIPAIETGELNATAISHLLRAADFGIAPHPWALIGKSGAAAAMLDHGLPVLVPRDEWHLRGDAAPANSGGDPLLVRLAGLDAADTDRWLARRRAPRPALPRVTDAFLQTLLEPLRPTVSFSR